MTSILFRPLTIGNMVLKNRFVRSATFEGYGTYDGCPTKALHDLYANYAKNDVALIVSTSMVEHYKNLPDIPGIPYPLGFDEDRYIESWHKIVCDIKKSGCRIAMQIMHPGRQEMPELRGSAPVAPSPVPKEPGAVVPHELSSQEIEHLIDRFVQAGRRVFEAGFDAVQLHGAHGYLISNFLSPHANRRTDRYGGSLKKRARFVTDIVKRLRLLLGPDFPVMIKMNGHDFLEGGLEPREAAELAVIFEQSGVSAVEVSGGTSAERWRHVVRKKITSDEESHFRDFAHLIRQHARIPVILVGGNRTFSVMETLVSEQSCDLVALSRPLIREPDLIMKFRRHEKDKADCISCNACFRTIFSQPVSCPFIGVVGV